MTTICAEQKKSLLQAASANTPDASRTRKVLREELAGCGLQFTYVRAFDYRTQQLSSKGGAVLAWKMPAVDCNVLEVSISWCHPNTSFDSVLGRYAAMADYLDGRCINIRRPLKGLYSKQLREIFQPCVVN